MKTNYRDNPHLRREGVKLHYTQEQLDEYVK